METLKREVRVKKIRKKILKKEKTTIIKILIKTKFLMFLKKLLIIVQKLKKIKKKVIKIITILALIKCKVNLFQEMLSIMKEV